MNRNRGSGGGEAAASPGRPTGRRAGAEVIYVGRSSFWVERDIDLFQEMPESPWSGREVASAAYPERQGERVDAGAGIVVPPEAVVGGGAGVILGINLSGPIILQAAAEEVSRRDDSHGAPLLAGEVAYLPRPLRARWSLPSPLTSLMIVTVVAFSLGLVVSPLGDATVLGRSGARTTLPPGIGTAAVPPGRILAPPSDNAFRPLVVPSPPAGRSRSESPATVGRAPRAASKSEHVGLTLAIKKHGVKPKFATRAPSRGSADLDLVTDGDQEPSRKSIDKESIDATKASGSAESETKAAKPWVDPWAN